jgi:hypothetical protein
MDEKQELRWRRQAIRWLLQGHTPAAILARIPRCRSWLHKWAARFDQLGRHGLHSRSRRPQQSPHAYTERERRLVWRERLRLERCAVGLVGPAAIQAELHASRLLRRVPSLATIKRILRAAGVYGARPQPRSAYFPQPRPTAAYVVQALDWTARYLAGGQKVFAFHTVDLQTHALCQSVSSDKSVATALAHALHSWRQLGLPDGLQLDNDAAFCGGYKKARVFGRFIRLCLYCGVEPIFLPPGEPRRNGVVERLNGLWAQACWQRRRFRSPEEAARACAEFVRWHAHEYRPPALHGLTPAQAERRVTRRRLTAGEVRALPEVLPLTAGRVHFLRRVDEEGRITLLNETWAVGRRLRGQYVWVTVVTHERRLEVYHRRAAGAPVRLVKVFRYQVHETVLPLRAAFKRRQRRRKVSTMS